MIFPLTRSPSQSLKTKYKFASLYYIMATRHFTIEQFAQKSITCFFRYFKAVKNESHGIYNSKTINSICKKEKT